ncbi:hypothetical protein BHE74_00058504 [Ensete ventricosum]|nr:hypothetical protein BHE74_00058504 [Ensete ventricosum]
MAFPQTESLVAPYWETQLEAEPPQRQAAEARTASPTAAPARSQSRSCDPIQTNPDFNTLSSDTANSLREQVGQVHQRLDEVQKEILKSKGEIGESSKSASSFTPEIQGKPLSTTFRLPTLELYDGSGDPTEHIVVFRAQMALYDTSDALMCQAFPTTLRGPTGTCPEDSARYPHPAEQVLEVPLRCGRPDMSEPAWHKYGRARRHTADLTRIRWARPTSPNCRKDGAHLAVRTTDGVVRCDSMISNKEEKSLGYGYPVTVTIKTPTPLRRKWIANSITKLT